MNDAHQYPPLEKRDMPAPPALKSAVGVGLVTVGLAIGTGELIMWPHLTVKYGLGLLWMALLGLTFQYFINQEVARHTLATGESFFTTSARVIKGLAIFWLISAVLLYLWPGWASTIGSILVELFGFGTHLAWSWVALGMVLVLTFSGRVAYPMLEKSMMVIVPAFFLALLAICFVNLRPEDFAATFSGLVNFGHIPPDVDINVLLGAVVFAGTGGMLNLCVSLWYRDKQAGMAGYVGRITNPITGKAEAVPTTGYTFDPTPENVRRWKGWMRYIKIDQGVIFWLFGLITLVLLVTNAYTVLTPKGFVPEGLNIVLAQAHIFGEHWGDFGVSLFLAMAALKLFSVMWAIIDALTRMVSDILYTNSRVGPFRKYFSRLEGVPISRLYYAIITGVVLIGATLLPAQPPLTLLVITGVLGGLTMAIYTPFLIYINNFVLPKPLRPGLFTNVMMVLASFFFLFFAGRIIAEHLL